MDNEFKEKTQEENSQTIGELKDMPKNDGWGKPLTIGEAEGWPGIVEDW